VEHLLAAVDQGRLILARPGVGVAALAEAVLVFENGLTVAVLNAVNESWTNLASAVGEHRIARRHPHHGGLARTQRHCEHREHLIVDAETAAIFCDKRHAHVLRETNGHHVSGQLNAGAESRWAIEFAGIVFRTPDPLPAA